MDMNEITGHVVDAAIRIHTALGPGLLESAYQACLHYELSKRRLRVLKEVGLPLTYDGAKMDLGYRLDLLVEGVVVIEVKSVDSIHPIHTAQILSYLKLSDKPVGLLLNFNVVRMKDGIYRYVN